MIRYLLSATLVAMVLRGLLRLTGLVIFLPLRWDGRSAAKTFGHVPKSAVSLLKFRASYGVLGNDKIGDYLYQANINTGIVYNFGDTRVVGGLQTSVVDQNIKWEEKTITNVGFDGTFINNHLDFSAEYYNAKSTDVLVGVPIPATVGSINLSPVVNAATLQNSGFEFSTTYHKTGGEFTFDISANLSTVKNKVLALGGFNEPIYGAGAKTAIGGEVGEHYGFVYEGIFQTQAQIDAHATQFGANLAPGDVKYKDISGPDGKPDGVVNEAYDRVYLGSAIPKYQLWF